MSMGTRWHRGGADIASREGGERRTVAKHLKKREVSRNPFGLRVHARRRGRENVGVFGDKRKGDERRLDMSKACGLAS